jgi:hypothetical protein
MATARQLCGRWIARPASDDGQKTFEASNGKILKETKGQFIFNIIIATFFVICIQ